MDIMRRGVALIRKFLRPYYYTHEPHPDDEVYDPYAVNYKSTSGIRRDYMYMAGERDYKEGVVRDLTYTW